MSSGRCALIGGETAEMPGMYEDEEYDVAEFTVGMVDQKRVIDGLCKLKFLKPYMGIRQAIPTI